MLKNYFTTTFRNLKKNRSHVLINVFGMGIAIACCIVAYINYDFGTHMDKEQPLKKEIYRINSEREYQGTTESYGVAPVPLYGMIQENFSEVVKSTRFINENLNIKINDEIFNTRITLVDPDFANMFHMEFLYGNPEALEDKSKMFITDEIAQRYFGKLDVIGEQLAAIGDDVTLNFTVGAVVKKMPGNSSFNFGVMTHIQNWMDNGNEDYEFDWAENVTIFLQIPQNANVTTVTERLQPYISNQNQARQDIQLSAFYLDPFEGIGVRSSDADLKGHRLRWAIPSLAVTVPMYLSICILLIACFNFTNTSVAISSRRLKEIGIRKVMGGYRGQLISQFMFENLIICTLGLLMGLVIAYFLIPAYSSMWNFLSLKLDVMKNVEFFGFMIALLIAVSLLAGGYPALYISNFQPTEILKGKTKFSGTNYFTRSLMFFQYFFCVLSIIIGLGFWQNSIYQNSMDLGYETDNIFYHYIRNGADYRAIKSKLESSDEVEAVAGTNTHIGGRGRLEPVKMGSLEQEVNVMNVGHDYFGFMGLEIKEGRGFRENSESDRLESIVVNETFVKTFGLDSALEQKVIWMDSVQYYIVGVLKDFYTYAMVRPIDPTMFKLTKEEDYRRLLVKSAPGKISQADDLAKAAFLSVVKDGLWESTFMNDQYAGANRANFNAVKTFLFLGGMALILTTIGLYSLASLNILKRQKEIGVRKVMGATVSHIVQKISKEFIILLLASMLVGIPLAHFLAGKLMNQIYYYYEGISVITISIAAVTVFGVAALTLGGKIRRAAKSNPVDTLRSE